MSTFRRVTSAGSQAPFIVVGDSGYPVGKQFFTILDNLINAHRVPPIAAILIGAGGQDAQGSERGFEYDAVNGAYAEFVENEVLPLAESHANIKLTKNPEGRATMGISSSGSAAFTMAWFHPELYHRVLTYSPTVVNQQWPHNPALAGRRLGVSQRMGGTAGRQSQRRGRQSCEERRAFRFAADPQQPDEADPHLVRDWRPRSLLPGHSGG